MHIPTRLAASAAILFASGCATIEEKKAVLASWIGSDVSDVQERHGAPNEIIHLGGDSEKWTYSFTRKTRSMVPYYDGKGRILGYSSQEYIYECSFWYAIGPDRKVTAVDIKDADCSYATLAKNKSDIPPNRFLEALKGKN